MSSRNNSAPAVLSIRREAALTPALTRPGAVQRHAWVSRLKSPGSAGRYRWVMADLAFVVLTIMLFAVFDLIVKAVERL